MGVNGDRDRTAKGVAVQDHASLYGAQRSGARRHSQRVHAKVQLPLDQLAGMDLDVACGPGDQQFDLALGQQPDEAELGVTGRPGAGDGRLLEET